MKKGKRIERVSEFKTGEKYLISGSDEVLIFEKLDSTNDPYFLNNERMFIDDTKDLRTFRFMGHRFYKAVPTKNEKIKELEERVSKLEKKEESTLTPREIFGDSNTWGIDFGKLITDNYEGVYTPKIKNVIKGRWHDSSAGNGLVYCTDENGEDERCFTGYGFDFDNEWLNDDGWMKNLVKPISNEKAYEKLCEYARSIGIKEGVSVRCLDDGEVYEIGNTPHPSRLQVTQWGELCVLDNEDYGICIMKNGKWAEIIEEKPRYEEVVNNTTYKVIKNENSILDIEASVGVNGVKVIFRCTETEWVNYFTCVQKRLREILEYSKDSI